MRSAQIHTKKACTHLHYLAPKRLPTMSTLNVQSLAPKWLAELPPLTQEGLKRLCGSPTSPREEWKHVIFPHTILMSFNHACKLCYPKSTNSRCGVTSEFSSSPLTTIRNHGCHRKSLLLCLLGSVARKGNGQRSKISLLFNLDLHHCRYVWHPSHVLFCSFRAPAHQGQRHVCFRCIDHVCLSDGWILYKYSAKTTCKN